MDADVTALSSESGALLRVTGVADTAAGRYRSLTLEFVAGVLLLSCDDDTDEIIVEVGGSDSSAKDLDEPWVADLLSKWVEYAWELKNHRGYVDAFQLRLMDDQRNEAAVQFEVAASAIDVRLVVAR